MSAVALIEAARELQAWESNRTMDVWYGNTLVRVAVPQRATRPLLSPPKPAPAPRPMCSCGRRAIAKNRAQCSLCDRAERYRNRTQAERERDRARAAEYRKAHRDELLRKAKVRAWQRKREAKPLRELRTCACGKTFSYNGSRKCHQCKPKLPIVVGSCIDCSKAFRAIKAEKRCMVCRRKHRAASRPSCICGRPYYCRSKCQSCYNKARFQLSPESRERHLASKRRYNNALPRTPDVLAREQARRDRLAATDAGLAKRREYGRNAYRRRRAREGKSYRPRGSAK